MYVYVSVYMCSVCMYLRRPEEDPIAVGIKGDCELLDVGSGNKLKLLARGICYLTNELCLRQHN